ncbi:MAG: hypothetical protein HY071_01375 [Chloroflexi bacterium]|nr:hypothetical protein [Chloroflexota bacterium]
MSDPRHERHVSRRLKLGGVVVGGLLVAAALLPVVEWVGRPPALETATPPPPTIVASPQPTGAPASGRPGEGQPSRTDHQRVYFARAGLPPVGVHVEGIATQTTAEERIRARLDALNPGSLAVQAPLGAFNPFPLDDPSRLRVGTVTIQGDAAVVDFVLPEGGWRVATAEQSLGLVQELVYTATEEPGIRRASFTANGGKPAPIRDLPLGAPLTREAVFGYPREGSTATLSQPGSAPAVRVSLRQSVDEVARGLARVVIDTGIASGPVPGTDVAFTASVRTNDERADPDYGKWLLTVHVANARSSDPPTGAGTTKTFSVQADRTPLRSLGIRETVGVDGLDVLIGLDDLRPWRVSLAFAPVRVVVDIGGAPSSLSDGIAVYAPQPGETIDGGISRTIVLGGAARAFEGNVRWRLRDATRVVGSGFTTASLGTSAIWGLFETRVDVPSGTSGALTLEVFEASAKDGSDLNVARVPLLIR